MKKGKSITISDILYQCAQESGNINNRSIVGQIEYWAKIGNMLETTLTSEQIQNLLINFGKINTQKSTNY